VPKGFSCTAQIVGNEANGYIVWPGGGFTADETAGLEIDGPMPSIANE